MNEPLQLVWLVLPHAPPILWTNNTLRNGLWTSLLLITKKKLFTNEKIRQSIWLSPYYLILSAIVCGSAPYDLLTSFLAWNIVEKTYFHSILFYYNFFMCFRPLVFICQLFAYFYFTRILSVFCSLLMFYLGCIYWEGNGEIRGEITLIAYLDLNMI
jgi:hypothetical protein